MIEKTVQLKAEPKEVAELLFELDNTQVAEVFAEWKLLFDKNYEEQKDKGKNIFIYDLNHFMLYVAEKLDDDGREMVRSMYSSVIYFMMKDINKKHLLNNGQI